MIIRVAMPSKGRLKLLSFKNVTMIIWHRIWIIKGQFAKHKSRQSLLKLDDFRLKDIGITRAQAEAEAAKGFWE